MVRNNASNANRDFLFIMDRIREFGGIDRLGHVFQTRSNGYYYDSGTGKVIHLESDEYAFFKWLFDKSCGHTYEDFQLSFKLSKEDALLDNIRKAITDENLLQAPFKTEFISPMHKEGLDISMQDRVRLITLELTEECNLRCRYCIYNDQFDKERGFSKKDMSMETVKAAIDFLATHGGEKVSVAFYGGEPLLKFDLIQYAVGYSKQHIQDKALTFSMTTNMTLMTREMADFFASIDNFNVVCSIDGPEKIHDQYRKYANGNGSHKNAIRGLQYLTAAYKKRYGDDYKSKLENQVLFSMVFTPPFIIEKVQSIQDFFEGISNWLPLGIEKIVTYVEKDSLNKEEYIKYKVSPTDGSLYPEPLMNWTLTEYSSNKENNNLFTQKALTDGLLQIHNRPLINEPVQALGINGCCVPGIRRSYICTNGDIKPCEKIGICPPIGNVFSGFDKKIIIDKYINEYEEKTIKDCNDCWAFNLCGMCYMRNYTESEFDLDKRLIACHDARIYASMILMNYHHILETNPERLLYLNDIIIE